jgi:hypothetical protein
MTDIFKLIFEHDLRLDQLRDRHTDRDVQETSQSIEDFMRPDPTYSKFYITATVLPDERFGIDQMKKYPEFLELFESALQDYKIFGGVEQVSLSTIVEKEDIGEAIILTKKEKNNWDTEKLRVDHESNVGHKKEYLAEVLQGDDLVLYKEHAHQGFDLHLFSKKNIYSLFFESFKKLISDEFRFFSINGKRIRSERKFYFETWTLDRPPHGAEEVFENTVI